MIAAALGAAACSSGDSTGSNTATCSGVVDTVPPLGVQTVDAASAGCVAMPSDGSTYIVVPQYASGTGGTSPVNYQIGTDPAPAQQDIVPRIVSAQPGASLSLQAPAVGLRQTFDFMLRERERQIAASGAGAHPRAALVAALRATPIVGTVDTFWVCSDLNCTTFKKDTAVAKYVGSHIAIFMSQNTPSGGLTAGDITALGNTFDQDLYDIDVNTFGAPSDIDGNGRVIVLMSPKVNAMTPSSQCSTQGYIAGFFFGADLVPTQSHSNDGEIFYSIVPDSNGTFSCAHSATTVKSLILATFIHEFQHMISWNQHVIVRGGNSEDTWLNEGMSHIAEELGSRYYEQKYPAPSGRANPAQLFPDSSQGFISGDLYNSYTYLQAPGASSVTIFANSGSLQERGAAWIFLRWLGDLKDSTIYGKLDQTALTGITNVETQAGESFQSLFGDFAMAVYSDSLPGMPRASAPARDRFVSRNLRQIYARLNSVDAATYPLPFPVTLPALPVGSTASSSMLVGTMHFWKLTMPSSGGAMRLHFTSSSGGSFPSGDHAQVTVLHCPSALACP